MSLAENILEMLFDSQNPVSGETMAGRLGVSRTAVWKGIRLLREKGFEIEARPGVGYVVRSYPDRLLPLLVQQNLHTRMVGRKVVFFESTDSTNVRAKALAESGEEQGVVVLAEEQTRGKGRLDRTWVSPRGRNLLFSIIFRPRLLPTQIFRLNMISSVSIVEAVESLTPVRPLIKWPNDVYVGNKKLAGILTEFSGTADGLEYAVVGIGLNVNVDPRSIAEISDIATSLQAELGCPISRIHLLREILRRVDHHYQRLLTGRDTGLREHWNSLSLVVGKDVTISSFDTLEQGRAMGIDEDGALIIRDRFGQTKRILCGDVSLRLA